MRIRTIKPEFWTDKRVAEWDHSTRLLYIGLWSAADDHGRGSAEPARLASELFPYDLAANPSETLARLAANLARLAASRRVVLYTVEGETFYEVQSWAKHQRIDNAGKPRVPTPSDGEVINPRETRRESPRIAAGTGIREQGSGIKGKEGAREALAVWSVQDNIELPEPMRTQECLEAVKTWLAYKRERGQTYKPKGLAIALGKWAKDIPPADFPSAVEHSIANNWAGLFPAGTQHTPRLIGTDTPADAAF